MSYCTLDDIKKLIPEESIIQLTDDEGLDAVNQTRIDEAIASADSEINTYLGARYALPLSSVPAVIRKLSVDIVIYNLYSRRVEKIPETRAERYKSAVKLLENISKGIVTLGVDPLPTATDTQGGVEINKTADDRVFTKDKLQGY